MAEATTHEQSKVVYLHHNLVYITINIPTFMCSPMCRGDRSDIHGNKPV